MRGDEERVDIVLRRASRIRRRHERAVVPALSACAVLLGVGLIGAIGAFAGFGAQVSVDDLYGYSSLLGSEIGGYVIVAVISFALAVVLTYVFMKKAKKSSTMDLVNSLEKDEHHE